MPTHYTEAEYGRVYKDEITGFEGTCTAVHFYISGCNRADLEAKADNKAGKLGDAIQFDTTRLIDVLTKQKIDQPKPATQTAPAIEKRPGGPRTSLR